MTESEDKNEEEGESEKEAESREKQGISESKPPGPVAVTGRAYALPRDNSFYHLYLPNGRTFISGAFNNAWVPSPNTSCVSRAYGYSEGNDLFYVYASNGQLLHNGKTGESNNTQRIDSTVLHSGGETAEAEMNNTTVQMPAEKTSPFEAPPIGSGSDTAILLQKQGYTFPSGTTITQCELCSKLFTATIHSCRQIGPKGGIVCFPCSKEQVKKIAHSDSKRRRECKHDGDVFAKEDSTPAFKRPRY